MEPRLAWLESDIARLRSDVASIEANMLALRGQLDREGASIASLRRRSDPMDRPALVIYIVLTATLLAALWRGFGWI
jgi:hypothetical protein